MTKKFEELLNMQNEIEKELKDWLAPRNELIRRLAEKWGYDVTGYNIEDINLRYYDDGGDVVEVNFESDCYSGPTLYFYRERYNLSVEDFAEFVERYTAG